jgi:glycosyltransferase involved in cell wall biosynthesis
MNILVLNIEYPPIGGGASPFCKEISEAYVAKSNHVDVVTMHHASLSYNEIVKGVNIYRVPCGRKKLNMSNVFEQLRFLYHARKIIKQLFSNRSYDYCHCHFLIPTGILAWWVKVVYKVPYLVTIHGSDVPDYNPDRFKLLHIFTKPLLNWIANHSSWIVSPSYYLASLLKRSLRKAHHDKIKYIPYSIALPEGDESKKENVIMSSGRLLKRKGFHTLVKAVKDIVLPYEVHIFGDGPERSNLEELAKGSKTKIVFHGWVDNNSKHFLDHLSKAKIFCLVSSHENSSVSIMEAMTHRCAIISSDQTGCKEMVEDIGVITKVDDAIQLKEKLKDLINNEGLIQKYGLKAFQKATVLYDGENCLNKYLDLMMKA